MLDCLLMAEKLPETSHVQPVFSEDEKKYLGVAGSYLKNLFAQDERLAEVMAGKSNLEKIKAEFQRSQNLEKAEYLKYQNSSVPTAFNETHLKIQRIHQLHIEMYDEYLKYWKDKKISHIDSGTAKFKMAFEALGATVRELTAMMEGKTL